MTSAWPLVESVARLLERDEREAVLGDSLEAGDSPWQALSGVFGFIFRRQILLWRSWRPWLSVFVIGLPCSLLLMYVSVSVTCTFDRLMGFPVSKWAPTGHEGFALLLCHILLLIAWSWTSGFTLGSLSPRTLWLNAALYCFLTFHSHELRNISASIVAPFLFLVPALWGIRQGILTIRLRRIPALLLAAAITALTTAAWINHALWVLNWLLLCPALYLLATSRRSEASGSRKLQQPQRTSL